MTEEDVTEVEARAKGRKATELKEGVHQEVVSVDWEVIREDKKEGVAMGWAVMEEEVLAVRVEKAETRVVVMMVTGALEAVDLEEEDTTEGD